MKIQIDESITAEWWDDGPNVVVRGIVRGLGFDVLLNIRKKYFLEEVPHEVESRATEISARVIAARLKRGA